jgi:hypothetical protein
MCQISAGHICIAVIITRRYLWAKEQASYLFHREPEYVLFVDLRSDQDGHFKRGESGSAANTDHCDLACVRSGNLLQEVALLDLPVFCSWGARHEAMNGKRTSRVRAEVNANSACTRIGEIDERN